jgi:hypothetical protein
MYGNVEYYIAMEAAKEFAKWREKEMDFTTINQIALIRQQEILAETANDRAAEPLLRPALRRVGSLFVTIGEKLVEANTSPAECYPSLENEACV